VTLNLFFISIDNSENSMIIIVELLIFFKHFCVNIFFDQSLSKFCSNKTCAYWILKTWTSKKAKIRI
jgi:hypothetical protein